MCIVSFVLDKEKFILTFNRDERSLRPTENPGWRQVKGWDVFCPLDKEGGGTWIGYNTRIVACLQNGAFVKHERNPPYRKSRGSILLEILGEPDYEKLLKEENFDTIEPFTLSIFETEKKELSVFRFDGSTVSKEIFGLDEPVLILSCTLYDLAARQTTENDFRNVKRDAESLFNFHDEYMIGKSKNQYAGLVPTISITQLVIENGRMDCLYFDNLSNQLYKL